MSNITLTIGNDKIDAWHVPAKGERIGGLVLVHEIFGITEDIQSICEGFAKDGYEVLAPHLFDRLQKHYRESPDNYEKALAMANRTKMVEVAKDLQVAIDYLKPPVFMVGYCYGGSATWVASSHCRGMSACASYYGRLIIDHVNEKPKTPIILHFGEHDDTIPMENVRLIEASHPDLDIYIYPAGHGFNSNRPTHHNKDAAELARERTLAHFKLFS